MPEALISRVVSERWNYVCPACGAEACEAELTIQVDTDIHEKIDSEPLWPGGPAVPVYGMFKEYEPGERWFSTSLCSDRFRLSEWTPIFTTRDGETVGQIEMTRRAADHG